MAKPTNKDLNRLKRLVRYLVAHPRLVFEFPFRLPPKSIQVYVDTDWAGCLKTRKSTQGGTIMLNGCCIKSWSTTQGLISLSSGESEYYGIVKGASEAMGTQSILGDMDVGLRIRLSNDLSAAKGSEANRGI